MVLVPLAAATDAGQSTNQGTSQAPGSQGMDPGQANQGNNQMQQGPGQGTGSDNNQQGNGQNNAGPGQGSGPQGFGRGNATELGNHTMLAPYDGNMTAPPGMPGWNLDNSTALNNTAWHGHRPGNMTDVNMTDVPPPGDWDPANMTDANQAWHGHGDGNLTMPAPPVQGNAPAQQQDQMNSTEILYFRVFRITPPPEVLYLSKSEQNVWNLSLTLRYRSGTNR